MKINYKILPILILILLIQACDSGTSISGSGNDSTVVLLSHGFRTHVNSESWTIYTSEFAESYITDDGVLIVESGPFPGGYAEIGYLISKTKWEIDTDDEYLITLRCSVCNCGVEAGNFIGLKCNGDDYYSADVLGVGFFGADYGNEEVIQDDVSDSLYVYSPDYELSPHCEGFHIYKFKVSQNHASIMVNGSLLYEITDSSETPFIIENFLVIALASSYFRNHCVEIDNIRIEKYVD